MSESPYGALGPEAAKARVEADLAALVARLHLVDGINPAFSLDVVLSATIGHLLEVYGCEPVRAHLVGAAKLIALTAAQSAEANALGAMPVKGRA